MGNITSWIRGNLVDNDRKGPTSPRALSDPELGRVSVAGRSSLEYIASGRLSLENNQYEGRNHSLLKKSIESVQTDYLSENNAALEQLKALCAEQQRTIKEYKEEIESQEQTIALLKSGRNSFSDSVEVKPNMEEYEGKLKCMEQTIEMLKSEKHNLLDRLSEIGAMKLKDGNPNITDLSDCNRPEKLTEKFSELYDNEWTDSYQLLTSNGKLKDKDAICTLLHILQVIYGICLSKSKDLDQEMKTAIENFLEQDCSSEENVDIQAFKEKMMYTIQDFRAQNCSFIPNADIKRKLRVDVDKSLHKLCKDYIAECSQVCWNMCIKNPPVYISSETDGLFNMDIYVPYTRAGPCIAYVVWPAVYLHKNGPIMKKGVAQGKRKKSTLTNEEGNTTDNTKDISSAVVKSPSNEKIDSTYGVKFINEEKSEGLTHKRRNSDPLADKHPQVHDVTKGKLKSKTLETPNKTKEKPSKIPRFLKADWKLKTMAVSDNV
ncbi:hypothetical protein CHS0354_026297 [Potamilus streckersoni]|uniref:Mitochondria-eating protein n=1 Tax=Potamilus streckersoni TaxID=2493646 RepID=A0AAE0TB41_9BIVA|nr:hypothetical protein CHS0354_026297 [Potamilus streckersoni]